MKLKEIIQRVFDTEKAGKDKRRKVLKKAIKKLEEKEGKMTRHLLKKDGLSKDRRKALKVKLNTCQKHLGKAKKELSQL